MTVAKLRAAAGVGLLHNRKYKQAARKFCEVSPLGGVTSSGHSAAAPLPRYRTSEEEGPSRCRRLRSCPNHTVC